MRNRSRLLAAITQPMVAFSPPWGCCKGHRWFGDVVVNVLKTGGVDCHGFRWLCDEVWAQVIAVHRPSYVWASEIVSQPG